MSGEFDTRACPRCGLETARAVRGYVLCGACGAVEPAPPERGRPADGLAISRREIVVRAALAVAVVVTVIVSGLAVAFRAYGTVNYRYLGAFAILLLVLGAATVGALAWAAGGRARDGTPGDGL